MEECGHHLILGRTERSGIDDCVNQSLQHRKANTLGLVATCPSLALSPDLVSPDCLLFVYEDVNLYLDEQASFLLGVEMNYVFCKTGFTLKHSAFWEPLPLTASLRRLLDAFDSFMVDNEVWKIDVLQS